MIQAPHSLLCELVAWGTLSRFLAGNEGCVVGGADESSILFPWLNDGGVHLYHVIVRSRFPMIGRNFENANLRQ